MTSPLIQLQQIDNRQDLAHTWEICVHIAREFPNDKHWGEVVKAFRLRTRDLGLELKG